MLRNKKISLKEQTTEQSNKEREEQACAACFFNWYNRRYKVYYSLRRAEEVFSQLSNITRWDFVATQHDRSNEWYAVEIKGLIRPQTKIGFVRWGEIFKGVTRELSGLLYGEFLVAETPSLQVSKSEKSKLRKVLSDVVLQKAKNMKKNESVNLGSEVLAQFPSWPFTPHLEMQPQPHIVKIPDRLLLYKTSDIGCLVEPGASPVDVFNVTEAVKEAIGALFDHDKEGMLQANEQLGLARDYGAKKTVLLLDCHLLWRPNAVRQIFASIDSSSMSNIDVIYLVEVSQERVSKVWPSGNKIQAKLSNFLTFPPTVLAL